MVGRFWAQEVPLVVIPCFILADLPLSVFFYAIRAISHYKMKYFLFIFIFSLFITQSHRLLLLFHSLYPKRNFLLFHRKINYQIYYYKADYINNRLSKQIYFIQSYFGNAYFVIYIFTKPSLYIPIRYKFVMFYMNKQSFHNLGLIFEKN